MLLLPDNDEQLSCKKFKRKFIIFARQHVFSNLEGHLKILSEQFNHETIKPMLKKLEKKSSWQ